VTGVVSLEELVDQMADLGLKTWDPLEKAKRAVVRKAKKAAKKKQTESNGAMSKTPITEENQKVKSQTIETTQGNFSVLERKPNAERTRSIRMEAQHEVHLRDNGTCLNCGSRSTPQLDHIEDFALGGSNEAENLRLLCRACNQRHAIESYGFKKMSQYLKTRCRAIIDGKTASSDFKKRRNLDRATFSSFAWMRKRKTLAWTNNFREEKIGSAKRELRATTAPKPLMTPIKV